MTVNINRLTAAPLRTKRTVRQHPLSIGTSMKPGVCAPLAFIPLLREDALSASDVTVKAEMMETHEILMNAANLRVTAYVVPKQAFDRFQQSRDQLDRSYMGQPQIDGGAVVPHFETMVVPAGGIGAIPILLSAGEHAAVGDTINTDFIEAYNQIINMRLRNRSPNLTKRARLDLSLAPAFWLNSQWQHVVPDFDQGTMDGEVPLNLLNARVPITGLGKLTTSRTHQDVQVYDSAGGSAGNYPFAGKIDAGQINNHGDWYVKMTAAGVPDISATLTANNISLSMADLAMAKKAQWYAKMREQFQGWADGNALDEYIIDMLMSGLSIPDQAMKTPMLIADVVTRFQQSKRYASDYVNMAESAVSGAAEVTFDLRVPRLSTGGVVVIMAEAMPDQLFERQASPYLFTTAVSALPDALRDELDTQKADIVTNKQVDVNHATPTATFGYEPLNGRYNRNGPRLGGKFHRPAAGATNDEVRQRLWAVETLNPTLGTSFYLCPPLNLKPFLDTVSDPFELTVQGVPLIEGNTVFGPELVENTNLYAKVIAKNPIVQAKP
jgi:hypothetical protein